MKVKELIAALQSMNPEEIITVWDPFEDIETDEVFISKTPMGILISNTD